MTKETKCSFSSLAQSQTCQIKQAEKPIPCLSPDSYRKSLPAVYSPAGMLCNFASPG